MFEVFYSTEQKDGIWSVSSTDVPDFVVHVNSIHEADLLCEAMTKAYRLGYSVGEAETQAAMRRTMGFING